MKFEFQELSEQEFELYKTWFEDEELNRALGPMKEETWELWQSYRTPEEPCIELSIHLSSNLIGVVHVSLSSNTFPQHCILAIAIHPSQKGKGLGSQILKQLMELAWFDKSKTWIAHVDEKNKGGIRFFEKNGWERLPGLENGMITYKFTLKTP